MQKRVLYAISSMWLWNASRSLVIINELLKKDVYIKIISFWNALSFLKEELKDYSNIEFEEMEDYPILEKWSWIMTYLSFMSYIIKVKSIVKKERKYMEINYKKYDYIYSDWRYWFYYERIPSYLIEHRISLILPTWLWIFQNIIDNFNYKYFKNFDTIMIPDFSDQKNNLSWKMSHNKIVEKLKHRYVWPLSSYKKLDVKENIDYLFLISWDADEHKTSFTKLLIEESKKLKWKKIFLVWEASKYEEKDLWNNTKIYSHIPWEKRNEIFNKAKIIISRAWYTTIMDIINLKKKAILLPLSHKAEQVYLAKYLWDKWLFIIWKDDKKLDLQKLILELENCKTCEFK